jgi:cytochrome c-type biogenesis protein
MPRTFSPLLRIDGTRVVMPTRSEVLVDAEHHRTTVVVFGDLPSSLLNDNHSYEMLVTRPTGEMNVLPWSSPLEYPDSVDQPRGISFGLLLTLAAGLLAAISPCLLQLTAFYIPTLAGVSADAAAAGMPPPAARRRVLATAGLFVLGFTVPYTLGGAAMGAAGQWIAKTGILNPSGPLAIASGAVMIAVAGFVAIRARAPMVCKMPMPMGMRTSGRLPLATTFVAGFSIATGCLACFGGAILGVLLVYTGLLGSAPLGALAMFVFSLGIAVPFMLAAVGLSRVLSVATTLQRFTPAIGLVTSAVMLFFGITMITGNFHAVSTWLGRTLPFL